MGANSPQGGSQVPGGPETRTGELPAAPTGPLAEEAAENILRLLARRRDLISKRDAAEGSLDRAECKRKLNIIDRRLREAGIDPSREARQ